MGAKDIAFEKERAKYRKRIRELQIIIDNQAKEEFVLRHQLQEAQSTINDKDEWIRRLLEYLDISPEEFRAKMKAEQSISTMFGVMAAIGGGRFY
jgi:Uma2 family endonuclease